MKIYSNKKLIKILKMLSYHKKMKKFKNLQYYQNKYLKN